MFAGGIINDQERCCLSSGDPPCNNAFNPVFCQVWPLSASKQVLSCSPYELLSFESQLAVETSNMYKFDHCWSNTVKDLIFLYLVSFVVFLKKKKPNQKIDYRHKFESSTFAFVRFEISTLLKLEISTLQKLEISSFRRVENFKLQKGWNQTQKQMIQTKVSDETTTLSF